MTDTSLNVTETKLEKARTPKTLVWCVEKGSPYSLVRKDGGIQLNARIRYMDDGTVEDYTWPQVERSEWKKIDSDELIRIVIEAAENELERTEGVIDKLLKERERGHKMPERDIGDAGYPFPHVDRKGSYG